MDAGATTQLAAGVACARIGWPLGRSVLLLRASICLCADTWSTEPILAKATADVVAAQYPSKQFECSRSARQQKPVTLTACPFHRRHAHCPSRELACPDRAPFRFAWRASRRVVGCLPGVAGRLSRPRPHANSQARRLRPRPLERSEHCALCWLLPTGLIMYSTVKSPSRLRPCTVGSP